MKKLLLFICIICLLGSCGKLSDNYTYSFKAEVTYTDGSIDTLTFGRKSFKGNKVHTYLKISESGIFSSGGTSPCLIMSCGAYRKAIACGVRHYKILETTKIPL